MNRKCRHLGLEMDVSQGTTGLDLLMGSVWDLRRFVTLRLNAVIPFWNFIPLQKITNKKVSLYAQIYLTGKITTYHLYSF